MIFSLEYIKSSLPNRINWNILNQLFEEDGIEITDEIRNYLNTTTYNTNLSVLCSFSVGEKEPVMPPITTYTMYLTNTSDSIRVEQTDGLEDEDKILKTKNNIIALCEEVEAKEIDKPSKAQEINNRVQLYFRDDEASDYHLCLYSGNSETMITWDNNHLMLNKISRSFSYDNGGGK